LGRSAALLVPAYHRIMARAEIAPVKPHLALPEPALRILHRLLPVYGRHRVPRPEPARRAQARVGYYGKQRMEAAPAGLGRIVFNFRALLLAILRLYRRVPVQHDPQSSTTGSRNARHIGSARRAIHSAPSTGSTEWKKHRAVSSLNTDSIPEIS